jgi:uncharacterized membrane protein YqiK
MFAFCTAHGVVLGDLFAPTALVVLTMFLAVALATFWFTCWLSVRYIPHHCVGIVEKLWSSKGSVPEGQIIALAGEAGYQSELLRGGLHFGWWRWQYRIHRARLVTVPQGKIGYVYARDGEPLPAGQTLGRVVACNQFQDARAFLAPSHELEKAQPRGQRGRQRDILREGVYAVNPALFVVITEDAVYALRQVQTRQEMEAINSWQQELTECGGFHPVVVGGVRTREEQDFAIRFSQEHPGEDHARHSDSIGIVTVHDGASLEPGEIIAPIVGGDTSLSTYHNNFQNPEAFLQAGGRRGRQFQALTDGTYFINRWFATVELIPKTVVPIGYVGVVVSYYGQAGLDLSGATFRHGELVAEGERGVRQRPLGPGKYAFNTYAGNIVLVPTTNFVLHWITGRSEAHRYDEGLRSIDLVTRDAYEPSLPLSVVVHIDYQRAPSVIQRFGDVKRLITQTLDPLLSAYFRDIAHKKTMLELLHERDVIQTEARDELRRRFHEFDIECVDVLIGKPDTAEEGGKIESLLEQLRVRQLSIEQLETYERQRAAADKLRVLNEAQAQANMQTNLTQARVQAQIAESQGEAELAKARKQAEQQVVMADAALARSRREAEQTLVLAEADSKQKILHGRGESQRILQEGLAESSVMARRISSFGDPRLYALSLVAKDLAQSAQPLVPERVFLASENTSATGQPSAGQGMLGVLLQMLLAERSGIQTPEPADSGLFKSLSDRLTSDALASLEHAGANGAK